jgi:hypothetical protein
MRDVVIELRKSTAGLLARRLVFPSWIRHIAKEATTAVLDLIDQLLTFFRVVFIPFKRLRAG